MLHSFVMSNESETASGLCDVATFLQCLRDHLKCVILHRFWQCFANAPKINVFSLFLLCIEGLLKMRDCALGFVVF